MRASETSAGKVVTSIGAAEAAAPGVGVRLWWRRIRRYYRSVPGAVGLTIILIWVAAAALAPLIAPFSPTQINLQALADPTPSLTYWLGTDHIGRDVLSRILWGARTVLTVAPIAVLGATFVGTLFGLTAGYFGGWYDLLVMRCADIVLSFPMIILYMIVIVMFGASALNIILVISVTKAPIIARIVRGITLELREREYVVAAKLRGESALFIMLVEILPNARSPIIVEMCLRMGFTIVMIGILGFLGIGLPPPHPDWGSMVKDTYGLIFLWPHMALFPCAAISSLVIGFNLMAIGLREYRFHG